LDHRRFPPRPLILLHGFTGSPLSFRRVMRALADRHTVLAPSLLGHDGGRGEDGASGFEAEVDRMAQALQAERLGPVDLLAYSLGARVGLGLLLRHPDLFASATLLGVHPGLETPAERAARRSSDHAWRELLLAAPLRAFVEQWEQQGLFESQRRLPREVLAEQRQIRMAHHPLGLARALEVLGLGAMPNYRPSLRQIELPVRLVAGELDGKFVALAQAMLPLWPRASLVRITDAGHNLVLERPDAVAVLMAQEPPATR